MGSHLTFFDKKYDPNGIIIIELSFFLNETDAGKIDKRTKR